MAKLTQQAAICKALLARGYIEEQASGRFRRQFIRPSDTEQQRVFVGKGGAFRRGRIFTNSISLERTPVRAMLLKEGGYSG